jgi:hypothetical protein
VEELDKQAVLILCTHTLHQVEELDKQAVLILCTHTLHQVEELDKQALQDSDNRYEAINWQTGFLDLKVNTV